MEVDQLGSVREDLVLPPANYPQRAFLDQVDYGTRTLPLPVTGLFERDRQWTTRPSFQMARGRRTTSTRAGRASIPERVKRGAKYATTR